MGKKILKIAIVNNEVRFPDIPEYVERLANVTENEFPNIYKNHQDVTFEEMTESVNKIVTWMMKNDAKYIQIDLEKTNEDLGYKKMTMKELEKALSDRGTSLTDLIDKELGYKVKIIEEVGKHEVNRSNKE